MLALAYLLTGLALIVAGVWLIAGVEWAMLAGGVLLVGLAVLERRGVGDV